MAKKDIGKILTTGSAKQRLLLLAEDIARGKFFKERLLTDSEYNQLTQSFKKPNEIKLYKEFKDIDGTITNAIINLQGLKFEVLMNKSNLRGYILVLSGAENTELLVNSVLHQIKDPKERKRIAEIGAKQAEILFSNIVTDPEGYIEIQKDISKRTTNLWLVMNNVKKQVETSAIRYLSWESAIIDYMDDSGFNVKTYKDQIKQMTTEVCSDIIHWRKYTGVVGGLYEPDLRLKKLLHKTTICPIIYNLKADEEQYNWFKNNFLDGEDYPDELIGKVNKTLHDE